MHALFHAWVSSSVAIKAGRGIAVRRTLLSDLHPRIQWFPLSAHWFGPSVLERWRKE